MSVAHPELAELVDSWLLALRAEHKSAATIGSYRRGVEQFLTYCAETDRPAVLDRATVAAFTASILERSEPTTAKARQMAVRRFSAWLADEREIAHDELIGIKPPRLDTKVIHPLTDEQIKAMVGTCRTGTMFDRRDEAILRFMVETGARAGEVVAMSLADVDLQSGQATIRRGKGAKGRVVPFGPQTVRSLDRWMRSRRSHKLADSPALWLGDHGLGLGYAALWKALKRRADLAGVTGFHPHRLRHTAAHRWLAAGGSEGGLMAVAGWSDSDMISRYTKARASQRAADESRRLNLGDY